MRQRNGILSRIFGIMGGIVLFVGLLAPFAMGSSEEKVQQLFQSAEDLKNQADYEGAIAKYTEALEESMKEGVNTAVIDKDFTTHVHYKIAVSYSRLADQSGNVDDYKTSIDYIEKVVLTTSVPQYQVALMYLWGFNLYRLEQFKQAELKFKQVIENFPNSIFLENTWYMIGQANYKLQDYEDARQAFKAILDGFPDSDFKAEAQQFIAQSFLNELNYEQAYQEFNKIATEEFTDDPHLQAEAMYKAAYSLKQLGRNDEAIKRYTHFIKQFPESPYITTAYFDQGAVYARQKDYHRARMSYESVLRVTSDPTLQAETQLAIGRTYFDQGDHKNALVSYNVLLEKYPDSDFIDEAKLGIADGYFRLEEWSKAIEAYERLISEHTEAIDVVPYSSYRVGEAYYKLSTDQQNADRRVQATASLELASQWYQKTIDNYPQDPIAPYAFYALARVYFDTGRWALVLEVADEAERKYATGDDDRVRDALMNIASLRNIAIKNIERETVE